MFPLVNYLQLEKNKQKQNNKTPQKTKVYQRQNNKCKTISRARATDPDMSMMLGLLGQEFKTPMINMQRALMDKVDGMEEQMFNVAERWKS